MTISQTHRRFLLLLPLLLLGSTALVFLLLARWLTVEAAYVLGFVFYWGVWCLLVPFWILKREGVAARFREEKPLFQRTNWLPAAVLILIVAITAIMYPPLDLLGAPIRLLLIALPVAIINGICEELLWRGLYVSVFPDQPLLAMLYPSVGFALWHVSPQLIVPASVGVWPFVASTFFLGISYSWIAYRTRSIRWTVLSHSLGGILDLGGAVAPALVLLLFGA